MNLIFNAFCKEVIESNVQSVPISHGDEVIYLFNSKGGKLNESLKMKKLSLAGGDGYEASLPTLASFLARSDFLGKDTEGYTSKFGIIIDNFVSNNPKWKVQLFREQFIEEVGDPAVRKWLNNSITEYALSEIGYSYPESMSIHYKLSSERMIRFSNLKELLEDTHYAGEILKAGPIIRYFSGESKEEFREVLRIKQTSEAGREIYETPYLMVARFLARSIFAGSDAEMNKVKLINIISDFLSNNSTWRVKLFIDFLSNEIKDHPMFLNSLNEVLLSPLLVSKAGCSLIDKKEADISTTRPLVEAESSIDAAGGGVDSDEATTGKTFKRLAEKDAEGNAVEESKDGFVDDYAPELGGHEALSGVVAGSIDE